jgi:hypothetical protein
MTLSFVRTLQYIRDIVEAVHSFRYSMATPGYRFRTSVSHHGGMELKGLRCPECGEDVPIQLGTVDAWEGVTRLAVICPNGHRTVLLVSIRFEAIEARGTTDRWP